MNNNEVNYSETVDIANLDKHIELINSHIDMFSDDFKNALANLVKCGMEVCRLHRECTLDNAELNYILNSIDNDTTITMTVHGNTNDYIPRLDGYGSWDLRCLDDMAHKWAYYGIDADSIEELREMLKEDFKSGIITMISVGEQTVYNNMTDIS